MGDVAWLTGSLAGAATLIGWLVRWIVRREEKLRQELREEVEHERQIAAGWRTLAETEQGNSARTNQILAYVLDNQRRIMMYLEHLQPAATGPPAGWSGSSGYDGSRHRRTESYWTQQT